MIGLYDKMTGSEMLLIDILDEVLNLTFRMFFIIIIQLVNHNNIIP